jgi:uncharacterized protein YabN with tetrapyrrole methylase and pyrophosphatase domain
VTVIRSGRAANLTIVGTGIQTPAQMSLEAKECIERSDKVFYLVPNQAAADYLNLLNPTSESLHDLYSDDRMRLDTYLDMADKILGPVRQGKFVCAAFYGHPGIFVYPSHNAIMSARSEGYTARMLAAPSAEDCLVADLGFDPAMGCQSFEATNLLLRRAVIDPSCLLLIWQCGAIGNLSGGTAPGSSVAGLVILTDYLMQYYGVNQSVIIYEASFEANTDARIDKVILANLPQQKVTAISTLCVPPAKRITYDSEMIEKLGLDRDELTRGRVELRLPPNAAAV